ncbi:unnamed protein product [Sphenostylis stenocarpa]|uniref:poly(A)-specific ribonuclease n=1 Tax=Sphenostylis stenocarpa TaxID=92480 RepID=A0AA86VYS6_9FABA|nr:unnamed protein product [Sphenostylis stenocarpa]
MNVVDQYFYDPNPILIREVWAYNLEYEFHILRHIIDDYPFISMDTEFPGFLYSTNSKASSNTTNGKVEPSQNYGCLKSNVDVLDIIQVGLTLSDANGNLPHLGTSKKFIWEFNFRDFDVEKDPHSPSSIALLRRQGIDFSRNAAEGIDSLLFAELMMSSGLVCNEEVSWVTFHGSYDFGYLVKILTRQSLPHGVKDFLETLKAFFGDNIYDLKHMIRFFDGLYGGLDRLAETLKLNRVVGRCHQAGSDSLLTWHIFEKATNIYCRNEGPKKYAGVLYGLELSCS